jgi:hypothetical protein
MSSEGKETDPRWQDTMNPDWDSFPDEDLPVDQELEEFPPPPDSSGDIEYPFESGDPLIVEGDGVSLPVSAPTKPGIWEYVRQYLWLVGVPLLFGGCTCLIILPLMALQRTVAPASALWPITFVIIMIAVAQGFALYKAGTNTNLWMVGTIGGFFLFVLLGCFVIFGLLPGLILLALLAVLGIVLARRAIHPVPEGYVELVSSLGKYSHLLDSGFNILWPWEEVTNQVNIQEKKWTCPLQRIPISPTRDIAIRASISYQVLSEGARLVVTEGQNWEQTLQQKFQESIGEVAADLSPDDVQTWQQAASAQSAGSLANTNDWWHYICDDVLQQVQNTVIQWCVQVNTVHIDELSLVRHQSAGINAEPTRPDAATVAQTKGTAFPSDAAPSRSKAGWSAGPSPESQQRATEWLQSTKEENAFKALEKTYKAVQQGIVTVPDAIRDLADKFDAVARDPQKSKAFPYDAARAARSLYKLAQESADLEVTSNFDSQESFYDDTTAIMRRPSDENINY